MNGDYGAAYLGGGLQQQYPTFLCGVGQASGPAITIRTIATACFPTHHHYFCTLPPRTFTPFHCSFVCNDHITFGCTIISPHCIPVEIPELPGRGPGPLMQAGFGAAPMMQQAAYGAPDCKNVMWTAGCTFAGQQQGAADCKNVMWTAGCTFAGQQQGGVDCKDVMWTAGCTFAGAQAGGGAQAAGTAQITLLTVGTICINPTIATHCFICPPDNCRPVLGTRLCTVIGRVSDQVAAADDCKNVMWTAGCTFAGQQGLAGRQAAATDSCGKVLTTLACTLGAAKGDECGNVLTTLACTLGAGAGSDSPLCITVFTHVPTWCRPDTGDLGCKNVMWTAGCTFAGKDGVGCMEIAGTTLCTFGAAGKDGAEQCGNVLTTLACTLSEDRMPKGDAGLDCKNVMWTAGCTFKGLGKGERCGDVLTTLACTLVAAPAEGQDAQADCKDVLWTAGCTFAATPSDRGDDCKVVAWTAGCTF
jgi:hypothetical protein